MTNPIDTIARGLNEHERAKSRGTVPLSGLIGAPTSVSDLNKLASDTDLKAKRLKELSASVVSSVENYERQARAKWADTGKTHLDNGLVQDSLGENQRRKFVADDVKAYRKQALAISVEERARLKAELRAINAKIKAVADMWQDPVRILMRNTIGSAQRGEFFRDLQHSGPVEVENLMRHAVLTKDPDLAAACFSRLDAMAKDDRKLVRVSRREVAEGLVGEDWRRAQQFMAVAEIAMTEAEIADDTAEGKRIVAQRKIGLGVKKVELQRALASVLGDGAAEMAVEPNLI